LLDELRARCAKDSQKVVAASLKFGGGFINDVIHERRDITPKLAASMGYLKMPDRYAKKEVK
jgi:plasmid maintenance system antidote protein VapI